ncbi:MAG: hypothetical protein NXY59_09610 [Aigarchaeota archaeon]|nr:hypothetical protein [Candidatus Pelearchaeum maunauluense]
MSEELPEMLKIMLELRKEMKRPEKRIGYMRLKRFVGEMHGYEDKTKNAQLENAAVVNTGFESSARESVMPEVW